MGIKRILSRTPSRRLKTGNLSQNGMFLRFALIADSVTLDATGKLNVMGIFDNIYMERFPSALRDMALVANVEGTVAEKGTHTFSMELRDSDSNRLFSFEQPMALKDPSGTQGILRAGVIARMRDLPFQRAGRYEFVLFVNSRFLGRVSFAVQEIQVKRAGEA